MNVIIVAAVAFAVPLLKYAGVGASSVFYITYIVNILVVSSSCIILNIKHGFLWYYPIIVLFFLIFALVGYFINEFPAAISTVFLNYAFLGYITSAIGGIIHKIRENNREE